MNTVRMITMAEHQYYGRRLHPGDEYDCEAGMVKVMEGQGWARPKTEAAPGVPAIPAAYLTRDMQAAAPVEKPAARRTRSTRQ